MSSNELIGNTVLSIELGKGLISGVEKLQTDGPEFFVVEFSNTTTKNFFPTNDSKNLRFVSSKKTFDEAMNLLKKNNHKLEFKSKKDQIEFAKKSFKEQTVAAICEKVVELNAMDELSPMEQKFLDKYLDTLALEASIVLEMKLSEAQDFVQQKIS